MNETERMKLVEAQLDCVELSLRAAVGNMGKMAGKGHWCGSIQEYKRLVSAYLKIQSIKKEVSSFNNRGDKL